LTRLPTALDGAYTVG